MIDRFGANPPLTAEAKRLYHVLLRTVAEVGHDQTTLSFPAVSDARIGGASDDFGSLVDAGLIEHDAGTGLVTAVLPFVANQPWEMVFLDGNERPSRFVAGTLDGFALASLLGRRARVQDWCVTCGEPVHVLMDPERIRRRVPRSAVVVRLPFDPSRQGLHDAARLACSPGHAQQAIESSGNPDAVMQSIEGLAIEARERYAALLP